MIEVSNYYTRFFNEITDRLDFVYFHPRFDDIKSFRDSESSFPFEHLVEPHGTDYGITASGKHEGSLKFVNTQNLSERGVITRDNIKYLGEAPDEKLLDQDEVLISRSRLVGRVAKVTEDFKGATFGSYIIRFKLIQHSDYLVDFLVKYLNCRFGQEQISLLKTGSSGSNINTGQLLDIRLPKISKDKQQSILDKVNKIESEFFDLEEKAFCIRENLGQFFVQEIGMELCEDKVINYFFKTGEEKETLHFFVHPDVLEDRLNYLFYHPRYKVLNQLYEKYSITTLEEICLEPIHRGEQPEYAENGEITVIKTVDLKSSYIDYDHCLKVSRAFFDKVPCSHVKKSDVLVASTGYVSMGKVDVYDRDEPAMVDGHVSIVRVKKEYEPYFVAYFLRSHFGQVQFEKWFSGSSGQIEIQPEDLSQIILPQSSEDGIPLTRQREIAKKITGRLNEFFELEKKADEEWKKARETFERSILEEIANQLTKTLQNPD